MPFPRHLFIALLVVAVHARAEPPGTSRMLLAHDGLVDEAVALSTDVDIRVAGMLARTTVTQVFENRSGAWAEGRFLFPLPEHSHVDTLRIRIGDRIIDGEVREKADARRVFAEARADGRSAGLVDEYRSGLYATTVTNVAPGETIEIKIGYGQRLAYRDGRFRLHFPTTLMPRYANGRSEDAPAADLETPLSAMPVSDRVRRPLRLAVTLQPGFEITPPQSRHHRIRSGRVGGALRIELVGGSGRGRDFELEWAAAEADAVNAALLVEDFDGRAHALLMLVPPADYRPRRLARELVLVLDRSGSMQGEAFEQARAALRLALDRVGADDHFNVIAFNRRAVPLFEQPLAATPARLEQAYRFLDGLEVGGGTEIDTALARAMGGPTGPERLRQIVFATDGSIANEAGVLERVRRDIGAARLFTVGIGHGVNARFLGQLARAGRGTLTRIADLRQIAERTEALLRRLEGPVLTDIRVDWPHAAETWPDPAPDLYVGEPLIVSARFDVPLARLGDGSIRATGLRDLEFVEMDWPMSRMAIAPGVARAWAGARIDGLDALLPGEMDETLRRDEMLLTALDYRVVSDQTSVVAVDRTPRRSREAALARHAIAGKPPADRDPAAFMNLPATDAGTAEALLRGLSALTIALLLIFNRRLNARASGVEDDHHDAPRDRPAGEVHP